MSNNTICVEVANYEDYSMEYKLKEFINKLNTDLDKVPSDFVEQVSIEIYANANQYGDTSVELTISYRRPQTEEELAKDNELIAKQISNVREKDLKEYNRLKEKLGL